MKRKDVERLAAELNRQDEYAPLGHMGWEAAAALRALLAERDAVFAAAPQPARINRSHLVATINHAGRLLGWRGDTIADDLMSRFDITLRNAAAPQPAPMDRDALVEVIREAKRKWYASQDGSTLEDRLASILLARGLRLPGEKATIAWSVVGEDGQADLRFGICRSRAEAEFAEEVSVRSYRPFRLIAIRVVEGGDDAA